MKNDVHIVESERGGVGSMPRPTSRAIGEQRLKSDSASQLCSSQWYHFCGNRPTCTTSNQSYTGTGCKYNCCTHWWPSFLIDFNAIDVGESNGIIRFTATRRDALEPAPGALSTNWHIWSRYWNFKQYINDSGSNGIVFILRAQRHRAVLRRATRKSAKVDSLRNAWRGEKTVEIS